MKRLYTVGHSQREYYKGRHRFEHWYRDNSVYFITSSVRDHAHAFVTEEAKAVFWLKFSEVTREFNFEPWIVSLLNNHYHFIGYLRTGKNLGRMMQRLHGAVAKLVNDQLPQRIKPFWRDSGGRDYFDGCLRDEKQLRLAHRYVRAQSVRHRFCRDWTEYAHTRVQVEVDDCVRRAHLLNAFMAGVPYKRYEQ